MPWSQNSLEKRLIPLSVVDIVADQVFDPTSYTASVAFTQAGVLPTAGEWLAATWSQDAATGLYYAVILIGPEDGNPPTAAASLAVGTHVAWVTINTGAELWADAVDAVTITGANYTVPVVSVNDLSVYMGYPFNVEQMPAVQQVLDALTGQLSTILKADLSIQQYTESYTVPGGPALWNNSVFGTNVADMWMDPSTLPMGIIVQPVYVKHWPIVSWDALSIQVPAQEGPTIAQTGASIAADVSIFQIALSAPLAAPLTSGAIVINDMGAPGGIGNTLQANTPGASAGSTILPLNAVTPLAPLVAGANVMVAAGFTWLSITAPTYPEDLPTFMPGQSVQVTYTAGWDGPNIPELRQVILRAAAREVTNRLDEAVGLKGGLNTVNLPDGPGPSTTAPNFTPNEIAPLRFYKRRVIV